jgi:hypothetical protein
MKHSEKIAVLLLGIILIATSSGICQTDTTKKILVNKCHVVKLIEDVEKGDQYKQELDTLSILYQDLAYKSVMQDSLIERQRGTIKICQDGWEGCESLVAMQKSEIEKMQYRHARVRKLYQAIIIALATGLILK